MSKKFAHERSNARADVRASIGKHGVEGKKQSYDSSVIDFGKYALQKKSPAELVFHDLGYFFWAVTGRAFDGWKQADAEDICRRSQHIKPPKRKSGDWLFLLKFDKRDTLKGVRLVRASEAPEVKPRTMLSKHLDLRWMVNPHADGFHVRPEIVSKLKSMLLGTETPTKWDCKEFWANERHFDMRCREFHCPRMPRHPGFSRGAR